jgi:hypothetical protein
MGEGVGGEGLFQDAVAGDVSPVLQPFFWIGGWIGGAAFVLDADGALFRLVEAPHGRSLERIAARVAAAAVVSGRLIYVEPASPDGPARIAAVAGGVGATGTAGTGVTTEVLLDGPGETAFFGYGGKLAHPEHGLVAVEHPGGEWEVLSARGRPFLLPFAGTQVVGAGRDAQRGDAGLLLLDEDRRTLVLAGLSWTRKLPPASAEIVHAAASPASPHVAYVTVSGEISVLSLDHDAPLVRLLPEGGP